MQSPPDRRAKDALWHRVEWSQPLFCGGRRVVLDALGNLLNFPLVHRVARVLLGPPLGVVLVWGWPPTGSANVHRRGRLGEGRTRRKPPHRATPVCSVAEVDSGGEEEKKVPRVGLPKSESGRRKKRTNAPYSALSTE